MALDPAWRATPHQLCGREGNQQHEGDVEDALGQRRHVEMSLAAGDALPEQHEERNGERTEQARPEQDEQSLRNVASMHVGESRARHAGGHERDQEHAQRPRGRNEERHTEGEERQGDQLDADEHEQAREPAARENLGADRGELDLEAREKEHARKEHRNRVAGRGQALRHEKARSERGVGRQPEALGEQPRGEIPVHSYRAESPR